VQRISAKAILCHSEKVKIGEERGINLEKSASFESTLVSSSSSSNPKSLLKKDSKGRLSESFAPKPPAKGVPTPFLGASQGELTPEKPHTRPPPVPRLTMSSSTERPAVPKSPEIEGAASDPNGTAIPQPTQMNVHRERMNTSPGNSLGDKPAAPQRPPRPDRQSLSLSSSQANAISQNLNAQDLLAASQPITKPPPPSRPRLPTSSAPPLPSSELLDLRKRVDELTNLLSEEINARRESEKKLQR